MLKQFSIGWRTQKKTAARPGQWNFLLGQINFFAHLLHRQVVHWLNFWSEIFKRVNFRHMSEIKVFRWSLAKITQTSVVLLIMWRMFIVYCYLARDRNLSQLNYFLQLKIALFSTKTPSLFVSFQQFFWEHLPVLLYKST